MQNVALGQTRQTQYKHESQTSPIAPQCWAPTRSMGQDRPLPGLLYACRYGVCHCSQQALYGLVSPLPFPAGRILAGGHREALAPSTNTAVSCTSTYTKQLLLLLYTAVPSPPGPPHPATAFFFFEVKIRKLERAAILL